MAPFAQVACGQLPTDLAQQHLEASAIGGQPTLQRSHADTQALCHCVLIEQTCIDLLHHRLSH
ncbi:hypothetical protein D3C75_1091830 [compost metagenome]